MYVIETQKVLDLNVNLMASYVIVPQTGFYDATQNLMLLDLGHFKVTVTGHYRLSIYPFSGRVDLKQLLSHRQN